MSVELALKYDLSIPRYTSYPTVPYWNGAPEENKWLTSIETEHAIDLYIHIPYCKQLCFYCGCFKSITKKTSKATEYVELLIKEWKIYLRAKPDLKINTIHFGGGTPTFLSAQDFVTLLAELRPYYSEQFTGSIELDPRTTTTDQLKVLSEFKFSRASLGIQDFNKDVQETINRVQSIELVEAVIEDLNHYQFNSINFDLIYGLPKQTTNSISETIGEVLKMKPNLIAFYSYAHLPSKIPSQKIFKNEDLPTGKEKKELYDFGKSMLEKSGYVEIGLDHFALKGSYLHNAFESGKLLRSFMGYTERKSRTMIGLGLSSISQTDYHYAQNSKDLVEYKTNIEDGHLGLSNGHTFSDNDRVREGIIQKWMCTGKISSDSLKSLDNFEEVFLKMKEFEEDGIIYKKEEDIFLTKIGKPYLRVIASSFDEYLHRADNKKVQFSSTI
jgi:oxygen-independent coproporphyrinogen III oxidase